MNQFKREFNLLAMSPLDTSRYIELLEYMIYELACHNRTNKEKRELAIRVFNDWNLENVPGIESIKLMED